MEQELKKKWVDALRSGEYKQYRGSMWKGTLEKAEALCCLGVLVTVSTGRHTCAPSFTKWGLSEEQVDQLVFLNDGKHANPGNPAMGKMHSFNEIADWIEENL
jgi:hypothetical protein